VNTYILPCATALHPLITHVEFHTQMLSLLSLNDEDFIPNNFIYNNKQIITPAKFYLLKKMFGFKLNAFKTQCFKIIQASNLNHILHLTTLIVPSGKGSFPCPIHLSYVCCTIPMVEVRCLWNSSSLLLKFVLTIMLLVTFMLKVFTSLHHVRVFVLLTHWSFQTSKLLVVHLLVFVYSSFEFCYCSLSCVVLLKV